METGWKNGIGVLRTVAVLGAALMVSEAGAMRAESGDTIPGKPFSQFPAKVLPVRAAPRIVKPGDRLYRTRIVQGMRAGVNFGGHFTVVEIGCGGGCRFGSLVDRLTGKIGDLPVGGEDYPTLVYHMRRDSFLLKANWELDGGGIDGQCAFQDFLWEGGHFRPLGRPIKAHCID